MLPRWVWMVLLVVAAWYLYVYLHHAPFWHHLAQQAEPPPTANLGDVGFYDPYKNI